MFWPEKRRTERIPVEEKLEEGVGFEESAASIKSDLLTVIEFITMSDIPVSETVAQFQVF